MSRPDTPIEGVRKIEIEIAKCMQDARRFESEMAKCFQEIDRVRGQSESLLKSVMRLNQEVSRLAQRILHTEIVLHVEPPEDKEMKELTSIHNELKYMTRAIRSSSQSLPRVQPRKETP